MPRTAGTEVQLRTGLPGGCTISPTALVPGWPDTDGSWTGSPDGFTTASTVVRWRRFGGALRSAVGDWTTGHLAARDLHGVSPPSSSLSIVTTSPPLRATSRTSAALGNDVPASIPVSATECAGAFPFDDLAEQRGLKTVEWFRKPSMH